MTGEGEVDFLAAVLGEPSALRAAGGFVIAQLPSEAGFDGMPSSAIVAGASERLVPSLIETFSKSATGTADRRRPAPRATRGSQQR